jgi:hypothetical protein
MSKTIEVAFDGNAFVPTEPVDLPAGTRLKLAMPDGPVVAPSQLVSNRPRPMTEEEKKKWEKLCRECESTPPTAEEEAAAKRILRDDIAPGEWETVEEALGRPKYEP